MKGCVGFGKGGWLASSKLRVAKQHHLPLCSALSLAPGTSKEHHQIHQNPRKASAASKPRSDYHFLPPNKRYLVFHQSSNKIFKHLHSTSPSTFGNKHPIYGSQLTLIGPPSLLSSFRSFRRQTGFSPGNGACKRSQGVPRKVSVVCVPKKPKKPKTKSLTGLPEEVIKKYRGIWLASWLMKVLVIIITSLKQYMGQK